jgi:hypothetical protein
MWTGVFSPFILAVHGRHLHISANANNYIVTCPNWYFVLYSQSSSIEGRMLNEDLADLIVDGKTVVLISILKDESVSFWTGSKWPDK